MHQGKVLMEQIWQRRGQKEEAGDMVKKKTKNIYQNNLS